METVNLMWDAIPAVCFGHLLCYKGQKSYFYPAHGPGVYAFVHGSTKREMVYQVYYIGRSQSVGSRLMTHYRAYASAANPDYYLPREAGLFDYDIHELFARNRDCEEFGQEEVGFGVDERCAVGRDVMLNTYFAFARVTDPRHLPQIEAALHQAVQRRLGRDMHGWLGEKGSPELQGDFVVTNIYPDQSLEKMLAPSIPVSISVVDGEVV